MKRPQFTETEEKLIEHIRNHEASARQVWLYYLPWMIGATIMFTLGLCWHQCISEALGFVVVMALLLRFIYYQCKPGWRVKPIVDKYEDAFKETEH
jgi:hypothetical protein